MKTVITFIRHFVYQQLLMTLICCKDQQFSDNLFQAEISSMMHHCPPIRVLLVYVSPALEKNPQWLYILFLDV